MKDYGIDKKQVGVSVKETMSLMNVLYKMQNSELPLSNDVCMDVAGLCANAMYNHSPGRLKQDAKTFGLGEGEVYNRQQQSFFHQFLIGDLSDATDMLTNCVREKAVDFSKDFSKLVAQSSADEINASIFDAYPDVFEKVWDDIRYVQSELEICDVPADDQKLVEEAMENFTLPKEQRERISDLVYGANWEKPIHDICDFYDKVFVFDSELYDYTKRVLDDDSPCGSYSKYKELQMSVQDSMQAAVEQTDVTNKFRIVKTKGGKEMYDGPAVINGERHDSVHFPTSYGSHRFTNDELMSLVHGETIQISGFETKVNGKTDIAGKLDFQTQNGRDMVTFKQVALEKGKSHGGLDKDGKFDDFDTQESYEDYDNPDNIGRYNRRDDKDCVPFDSLTDSDFEF